VSELRLIAEHFARLGADRPDVRLGVGDDCALLQVAAGCELAVSIDTLVSGVHFLSDSDPEGLGHKALAVGLSDLAAMGAEPAWATLALTLPAADDGWISAFARGFAALASAHRVALVGGDLTQGPLSMTVQVHGLVPAGQGIRRSGARPGDLVCVSGTLGDAGLALTLLQEGAPVAADLRERLERPTPRVALGLALRGLATAMIDLSDGLAADLGHILAASGLGAEVELARLPLSPALARQVAECEAWGLPVASGDDYELCFTVPPARARALAVAARRACCPVAVIGRVRSLSGLVFTRPDGTPWQPQRLGYDHFPAAAE